jgi:hypothetical protein
MDIINEKLLDCAKKYFKNNRLVTESVMQGDLEHLISPYVSIDQYTSKISDDDITIAFFCNEREVAGDLIDFLEKLYFLEIRDIEISNTLTEDNKYIVYVELDRNQQFPKVVIDMVDSINFLINKEKKDWDFVSFNMNNKDKLTEENIIKYVRLLPIADTTGIEKDNLKQEDATTEEKEKVKEIKKETVEYSLDNIKRTYLDEGLITDKEFDKIIQESELLNESLDLDILEYNLQGKQIIVTDKNAFIIDDNGIRKLGYM